MRTRVVPWQLADGYEDGWPHASHVGEFLELVRAGNTVPVAARVANLDAAEVVEWQATGEALAASGTPPRNRRPFVAFAAALERAEAECEVALTAVVMASAMGEERDAWRAAAWLLERNTPEPAPEAVPEEDVDPGALAAPVITEE